MDAEPVASFFEILYTTRALRRLKPDPVPDDVLFQLIDAAIRAPSGQNAQDWRFIIVTDPALKRTCRHPPPTHGLGTSRASPRVPS